MSRTGSGILPHYVGADSARDSSVGGIVLGHDSSLFYDMLGQCTPGSIDLGRFRILLGVGVVVFSFSG